MVRISVLVATFILFIISISSQSYSAESTLDVPVSSEEKSSARRKFLGEQVDNLLYEEYKIGIGDIVNVSIYDEGDMVASAATGSSHITSCEGLTRNCDDGAKVMMDGRISLLHIGEVETVGMTLTQLADYLKQLYSFVYTDPKVTVTLEKSYSLQYNIMGNIAQPGLLYLESPITVMQAIGRSGGFTKWANNEITIVREHVKEKDKQLFRGHSLVFDYDDFMSGKGMNKNVSIQSGDTLIVH